MANLNKMKSQQTSPVYAQCHICYKKYDMVRYGVSCPGCKDKSDKKCSDRKR